MLDGGKFICHKVRLQQNVGRKKNLEQKNKIKKNDGKSEMNKAL